MVFHGDHLDIGFRLTLSVGHDTTTSNGVEESIVEARSFVVWASIAVGFGCVFAAAVLLNRHGQRRRHSFGCIDLWGWTVGTRGRGRHGRFGERDLEVLGSCHCFC